ncbi:MAG: alpha/beta fold hydrolase [Sandaracinaceae bacterium]
MLVLLHGFTGSPATWDRVLAAHGLTSALPSALPSALRPWLPGHGPEPDPVGPWEDTVRRLDASIARSGARGAHLVGYSLGGRLAWGLLRLAPAWLARATLIGAHPGLPDLDRPARREADRRHAEVLRTDGLGAFVDRWEALPIWASQARLARQARVDQRRERMRHRPAALADVLTHLGLAEMPDHRPALPAIRTPVTLLVGAEDERHRELAGAAARRLPACRLETIPGVGHNPVLEAPEAVAEALRRPPPTRREVR